MKYFYCAAKQKPSFLLSFIKFIASSFKSFNFQLLLFLVLNFSFLVSKAQIPTLYGVTEYGGSNYAGNIFAIPTGSNSISTNISFGNSIIPNTGTNPYGDLLQASNGKLYGMARSGGAYGYGTLFEYNINTNTYSVVVNFDYSNGASPYGSLIQASNGKLYGMTYGGGTYGSGTLFEYDITINTYSVIVNFDYSTGLNPRGSLIQASNGKLYGMTYYGGAYGSGTLFEYDIALSTLSVTVDFDYYSTGGYPYGSLMQASNGKLYGMTSDGGVNWYGTLFEYDVALSTLNVTVDFDYYTSGGGARGSLIQASNGKLYGMTYYGGAYGHGTLFEYDIALSTLSVTADFDYYSTGGNPYGSLTQASNGKLYGMTPDGGVNWYGTLFEYDITLSTLSVTVDFDYNTNGGNPRGSLIQASPGKLYGTTQYGGAQGYGVLFEYDTFGTYTIKQDLHENVYLDGAHPYCPPMQASNGKLYGITQYGGQYDSGVLYEINPATNSLTIKADFEYSNTGRSQGTPVQASNGKLYGLSGEGGVNSYGTLFEYDITANSLSTIIDFDYYTTGAYPYNGTLLQASTGKLYGLTRYGGVSNGGTLFEYDVTTQSLSVKWDFSSNSYPGTALVEVNGKLYGLTNNGGTYNNGSIFEYDLGTGSLTIKYSFDYYSSVGAYPWASLTNPGNGKLYGTTGSGSSNNGTLFEYDLMTGSVTMKYDFSDGSKGYGTNGDLLHVGGGKLYGTTWGGGDYYNGVVFEYNVGNNTYTKRLDFDGSNGNSPGIGLMQINTPTVGCNVFWLNIAQQPFCPELSTASATVNPILGTAPYTYSWSTASTNSLVTGLSAGVYSVSVTDGMSCTATTNFTVVSLSSPSVIVWSSAVGICPGNTVGVTLTAGGANTYTWYPANTVSPAIVVTPTVATTYSVTGADGNGCKNSNTITITTFSSPVVSASAVSTVVCSGNPISLSGGGANTYTWMPDNLVGASIQVSPAAATIYSVTGQDAQGCLSSNTATIGVSVSAAPVPTVYISPTYTGATSIYSVLVNIGNFNTNNGNANTFIFNFADPVPPGGTVVAINMTYDGVDQGWGGSGCGTSFNINNNPIGGNTLWHNWQYGLFFNYTGAIPSYTYGATNQVKYYFCDWSGWASTISNAKMVIYYGAATTPICQGNTVSISGSAVGTAPITYNWSGGVSNGVPFTPTATTIYTFTAIDGVGCSNSGVELVTVYPVPNISVSNATICGQSPYTISASGAYSYTWSTGSNHDTTIVNPAVSTIYSVTGTSDLGCVTPNATTVSIAVTPSPTLNVAGTLLPNSNVTINVIGGTAPFVYSWMPSGGSSSVATALSAGQYTVDVTDVNSCSNSTMFVIGTPVELWGITSVGGANNMGVIFKYNSTNNTYTTIYDFDNNVGNYPRGSLMQANNGKLYGLVTEGGTYTLGTLFEYNLATNTYSKILDFDGINYGSYPFSSLVQASNGKLYGMTSLGGNSNYGVMFQYNPATYTYTKLVDFIGGSNGKNPNGSLLPVNNKLYGMTKEGGVNDQGVLFEYDISSNTYTKTVDFGGSYGRHPVGSLIQASNGKLYGMTNYDNSSTNGTLFEYDINTHILTTKHTFNGTDGEKPTGSLMEASNGKLYGLTSIGGLNNDGVLFEYDPTTDTYAKKIDFQSVSSSNPYGSLMQASNGKLYGSTYGGGSNNAGTLFEYDINTEVLTVTYDFNSSSGASPYFLQLIEIDNAPTCFSLSTVQNNASMCAGNSIGEATVTASGGTAPYVYSWSPAVSTSSVASSLGAGDYTVTVADDAACVVSTVVHFNTLPTAMLDIEGTPIICEGQNATLSVKTTTTGYGLDFDGFDDYVSIPYSAAINPSVFTVETWVKVNAITSEFQSVVTSRYWNGAGLFNGYALYVTPGGTWDVLYGNGFGSNWQASIIGAPVQTGVWTHVAMTHDGTTMRLYVNGVLTGDTAVTFAPNTTQQMRIGAGATEGSPALFFGGQIDEFRIWDYAMSPSQIQNEMGRCLSGTESGLVLYYTMTNGPNSSILTDNSNHGHTGTLNNMSITTVWVPGIQTCSFTSYSWNPGGFNSAAISVSPAISTVYTLTTINSSGCTSTKTTAISVTPIQTANIIQTIAGMGTGGYNADGIAATAALLNQPYGTAVDAAGNIYIADYNNHRIRKVNRITGIITTVAGTGVGGFSGDGGLAAIATFSNPSRLAIDALGNIFVSDYGNHRIRKINTNGIVSTIAGTGSGSFGGDGGPATSAQLNYPSGIAVDTVGNIYIADVSNNRIRKIDASTGSINTVTLVNMPYGVSVDVAGNVYITDTYNHRILKLTITTSSITTIAGTGILGYSGDGGLATVAQLNYPTDAVVDAVGNIYIVDRVNVRIRKINVFTGIITTIAGNGTGGYSGDGGPATSASFFSMQSISIDALGKLYIADAGNNSIRAFYPLEIVATSTTLCSNNSVTLTANGTGQYYTWNTGETSFDIVKQPTVATTYSVVSGCTSNSLNINVGITPTISVSGNSLICSGNSTSLTANGADTYLWTNASGTIATVANIVHSSSVSSAYSVIGTNTLANCQSKTNVFVKVSDPPTVNINPVAQLICAGQTASMGALAPTGKALDFDGINDRVVIPRTGNLNWSSDSLFTIETWFRFKDPSSQLWIKSTEGTPFFFAFSWIYGNAPYFGINNGSGWCGSLSSFGYTVTPDFNWHHVAAVYDGNSKLVSIYLDGLLQFSYNYTCTASASAGGNIYLQFNDWNSTYRSGQLDELRIWNVVRSQAEIQANMNACLIGNEPGLTAYYNMNQTNASVTNVVDNTGGLHVGTLSGMTASNWIAGIPSCDNITSYMWNTGATTSSVSVTPSVTTNYTLTVNTDANCVVTNTAYIVVNTPTVANIINTFAGNGVLGYSGDGGAATSANLGVPFGAAVDAAGNVYVTQYAYHVVRKISPNGNITTIAGTGTAGFSGDGGPATSAQLNQPTGVVVDAFDNVYITDQVNSGGSIRKVSANGIISTVYSGLYVPIQSALDAAGNIYVAESGNDRVVKITPSGSMSVFAGGNGAGFGGDGGPATLAQLSLPTDVAVDAAGNVYIADANNHRIRVVNTSGMISTIAGTTTNGYNGDNIPATSAQLNSPVSVAVDALGNIYITDKSNYRIRRVNLDGIITTIAGTGTGGYSGDGGPATAAQIATDVTDIVVNDLGKIYFTDPSNNRIRTLYNLDVTATASVLCGGSNTVLVRASSPAATYTWNTGHSSDFIAVIPVSSETLTVTAGCAINTIALTVNPLPTLSVVGNSLICSGGTTSFSVSGADTYSWSTGSTGSTITLTPSVSATYSVVGTNTLAGCQSTASVFVKVGYTPTLNISPATQAICVGQTATMTALATGKALEFDGSDDYVETPPIYSSEVTYELWVKPLAATGGGIFSMLPNNGSGENGFILEYGGGPLVFSLGEDGNRDMFSSVTGIPLNVWSHIAVSFDGSTMKIFINGVLNASMNSSRIPNVTRNMTIGSVFNWNYFFNGQIDEFRIWNYARSQTDIQTDMNLCLNGNENGLMAYYNFNGSVNPTTLVDNSGNGYTGTLNNMNTATAWVAGIPSCDIVSYAWSTSDVTNSIVVTSSTTTNYTVTATTEAGCVVANTADVTTNPLPVVQLASTSNSLCTGQSATLAVNAITNSYALDFDGVDDYVSIPYSSALNTNPFTIEFWAKVNAITGNYQGLVTSRETSGSGFVIYVNPTGNWQLTLGAGGGWTSISGPPVQLNQWTHITGTYDGAFMTFYVNGEATGAPTFVVYIQNTSQPMYIGSGEENGDPKFFFGGQIDEVRLWNTALNASQIQDEMGKCLSGNESNLAAYYAMTDGTGLTLSDNSPNGHTGALTTSMTPAPAWVSGMQTCNLNSYSWSSGGSTSSINISPASTTSYVVTYTNTEGCSGTSSINMVVNPLPNVVTGGTTQICSGSAAIINASGADTYSWSTASTSSQTAVNPTVNTTYTVVGTNTTTGCQNTATKSLTVNPRPLISVNSGSICSGNVFTIIPSGASTYSVNGAATSNFTYSPVSSTNYSVSGTSSLGCVSNAAGLGIAQVTVNITPTVSVNSGSICTGDSFTIIPSGTDSYAISGGTNIVSPAAGISTYSVIGTSTAGCVSNNTAISNVTVNIRPTISVNSGSICSGYVFTMMPSGAFSYTYSSGTNTVNPLTNASYSVTGTSSLGCVSASAAIADVTVHATPTLNVNSGAICFGSNFIITPSGADTYTVTGNNFTVSPASQTDYSVTGTSSAGCISSNTAISTVSVNPLPVLSITGNSAVCFASAVSQTVSGADAYLWSSGQNTDIVSLTPSVNTTYSVTGTNTLTGCQSQMTKAITVYSLPIISVNSGSICQNDVFTMIPSGAFTYTYSSGTNTVSPLVNTSYSVTGTDFLGCVSASAAIANVTVAPLPVISVASSTLCSGDVFVMTPSGAATYTYSNGSNTVIPLSNASYSITGTSSVGCISSNTAVANVTVIALPVLSISGNTTVCLLDSLSQSVSGTDSYVWVNTNQTAPTVTLTPPVSGINTYSVIGTSATTGCSVQVTKSIMVHPLPVIGINSNSVGCTGTPLILTGTGANTYTWMPENKTGSTVSYTPANTATYTAKGTDSNGCVAYVTSSIVIPVYPSPQITITPTGSLNLLIGAGQTTVDSGTPWTFNFTDPLPQGSYIIGITMTYDGADQGWGGTGEPGYFYINNDYIGGGNNPFIHLDDFGGPEWIYGLSFNYTGNVPSYTYGATNQFKFYFASYPGWQGFIANVNLQIFYGTSATTVCAQEAITLTASEATGSVTLNWSDGKINGVPFAAPNTSHVYTVSGTNSFGCTTSLTQSVIVKPIPTLAVNSGSICTGQSYTINVSGADTYTWSTASNNSSVVVNPLVTTSYTVSGTNSLNCTSYSVSDVTVNITPTVSIVGSNTVCSGLYVTQTAIGADTYTWNTSEISSSISVNPLSYTTYSVTGTSAEGCLSNNTAVAGVSVYITPTISVNSGTLCSGDVFTMTPSGASTYTFSNGSPTVNVYTSNTYSVIGTSSLGCTSFDYAVASVTVMAAPPLAILGNSTVCEGSSVTQTVTGGVNYLWSTGSTSSVVTLSPAVSTLYTVSAINPTTGCSGTASKLIAIGSIPVISVNSGNMCEGGTFTIIPSGAATYTFSSGSNTVSPSQNTSYYVTGTSAEGCVATTSAICNVIISPLPVISVNSATICSGNIFTIIPSGANTYTFSSGINTVSPLSTTNYSVWGTDNLGCVSLLPGISTVSVNASPTITVPNGTVCMGNSYTIVPSGTDVYTFSSGTNVVSPTANTSYSITGVSNEGCVASNTAVVTVSVIALPIISVNSGTICEGSVFTMTPTGAATYSYSTYFNTPTVVPMSNTSYSVTGTSSAGCVASNTAVASVTLMPVPTISVSGGLICANEVFTIAPSGADTYTYSSGSNTVSPNTTSSYTVTGSSAAGCVASNTVIAVVLVKPAPDVAIFANYTTLCDGNSSTLTAVSSAGGYTWSSNTGTTPIVNSVAVITPSVTDSYTVTATASNGCTNIAVQDVTVNPLPNITVTSGTICPTDTFVIQPSGAVTYSYSGGSATVMPVSGTVIYTVTGTDSNGCVSLPATASITVSNDVTVTVSGTTLVCSGSPAELNASGATNYLWSTSAFGSSIAPTPTTNSTYTVIGAIGLCADTAVISVEVKPIPSLTVSSTPTVICTGESASLTVTGASPSYSYTWSENSATSNTIVVSPLVTTDYTITALDTNACANTIIITQSVEICPGIETVNFDLMLNVYPNPNTGDFFIETDREITVTILNVLGQVIKQEKLQAGKNPVNLNEQAKGIYFVEIKYGNKVKNVKVVKQG